MKKTNFGFLIIILLAVAFLDYRAENRHTEIMDELSDVKDLVIFGNEQQMETQERVFATKVFITDNQDEFNEAKNKIKRKEDRRRK